MPLASPTTPWSFGRQAFVRFHCAYDSQTRMHACSNPALSLQAAVARGDVRQIPSHSNIRNPRSFVQQYDAASYTALRRDPHRVSAFREAIGRSTFIFGAVGVDLGAGRDALLSQMCVRAGAKKMFAIEANAEAAERAAQLIQALHLSDHIEVVHAWAQDLKSLPVQADFIVQEVLGEVASVEGAKGVVEHAQRHFVKSWDSRHQCVPAAARTLLAAAEFDADLMAGCIVGPLGRLMLVAAPWARSALSESTCIEHLQFAGELNGGTPHADGDGICQTQLGITRTGRLGTLRLHMEYLPHPDMPWHSAMAPFSHWRHVHVALDTAVDVVAGDTISLQWHHQLAGGFVLTSVEVSTNRGASFSCLHGPVSIDCMSLHGNLPGPTPGEDTHKPAVVLGSGDACWDPAGRPAVIAGYDDGQESGCEAFLLVPVSSGAAPVSWVPAEQVTHWTLGHSEHPLAQQMLTDSALPDDIYERAAYAVEEALAVEQTKP